MLLVPAARDEQRATAADMSMCLPCRIITPVVLAVASATAGADTSWNGSLGVTTDYLQQGLSQTRGEPAIQGGFRASIDNRWTVGLWGSNVGRYAYDSESVEIDLYAARSWQLAPDWIAAVTATHYFYPDDAREVSYDYNEVSASLAWRSTVFATVAWAPDYTDASYRGWATDRTTLSYEISANQPIAGRWSGNVGVGYRDLTDLFDEAYWYGHAGIMCSTRRLTLHLTYTYVDAAARRLYGHERADPTWSGAAIWRFGGVD